MTAVVTLADAEVHQPADVKSLVALAVRLLHLLAAAATVRLQHLHQLQHLL